MKKILQTVTLFCMVLSGASTGRSFEYSGIVLNDIGRPAAYATVTVSNFSDTSEQYSAVTDTTGIFSFRITGVDENRPVPFKLYGNFPNPFNPYTRISYSLDQASEVKISIYNVLGQSVRSIDHGYRQPGFYTAIWDGRDETGNISSAGVYLYSLEAGGRRLTSKMLMVDASTGSWIGDRGVSKTAYRSVAEKLYLITVTHPDAKSLTLGPLTINATADTVLTIERIMTKMQRVSKNTYMRGTDKRYYPHVYPEHKVTITHDFLMDKYEVTIPFFCEVMNHAIDRGAVVLEKGVGKTAGDNPKKLFLYEEPGIAMNIHITEENGRLVSEEGKEKLPISFVSWYGAMMFCHERNIIEGYPQAVDIGDWSYDIKSLGYRLPTDAEWELAAKWTDNREYAFGPDPGHYKPMNVQLNEDGFEDILSPVGWFSPQGDSHDGCCDISGNVYEWVLDWQGEYDLEWVNTVLVDPTGPERPGLNKVCRGGSATGCFRSARTYDKANIKIDETLLNIGFRTIRVLEN